MHSFLQGKKPVGASRNIYLDANSSGESMSMTSYKKSIRSYGSCIAKTSF